MSARRFAYADPPYIGCAHLYKDHPDYGGEVDHAALVARLLSDFDGFALCCTSVSLPVLLPMFPADAGVRTMAWVKTFAAFKRNVPVAYAWEPVLVKPVRKPVVSGRVIMRDWFACPMTMRKGLVGAKPREVLRWTFEVSGLAPGDAFADLFPGTGAASRAWDEWCADVAAPLRSASVT